MSKREAWQVKAESGPVTDRTAEEQLEALRLNLEEVRGKAILVLGPGRDFALEKALADAGADVVVALSGSFEQHEDTKKLHAAYPNVWPVRGYFEELPPAHKTFDMVLSVAGFPWYAYTRWVSTMSGGDERMQAELMERYAALIDTLAPGAQARLMPVEEHEAQALERLARLHPGLFTYTRVYAPFEGELDDLLIITKLSHDPA